MDEQVVLLRLVNGGTTKLLYPITTIDGVSGLDEALSQKSLVQIITWEDDD